MDKEAVYAAMILQCPKCTTIFKIDDKLMLPDGRKVRCTSCQHVWFQDVIVEDAVDTEVAVEKEKPSFTAELSASAENHFETNEKEKKPFFLFALILPLVNRMTSILGRLGAPFKAFWQELNDRTFVKISSMVLGIVFGVCILISIFINYREDITLRFPSYYNIYHDKGYSITASGANLVIQDANPVWSSDKDGKLYLVVEGKIYNPTKSTRHIPPLKATLLLKSGERGKSYSKQLETTTIEGQKKQKFSFTIPEWPDTANDILLSFDIEALN